MATKISCDNCGKDVIADGRQVAQYYEYDALPFPVAAASSDGRNVVCAVCDAQLRVQYWLPLRGGRGRLS